MEVKVEQAQPDMDAFDLYDDMREADMIECIGLLHHPKDAVLESFATSCKCYSVRSEEGLHCWLCGCLVLGRCQRFVSIS
jgi:hypothetical protein